MVTFLPLDHLLCFSGRSAKHTEIYFSGVEARFAFLTEAANERPVGADRFLL